MCNLLSGKKKTLYCRQFFILKRLIDILQNSKKKLYSCFVDFKQAFDTVWKAGLWRKLIDNGINGKRFDFIHNMYKHIKSKVTTHEGSSHFFGCNVGVRQGENLSLFLFSIFLNGLEVSLNSKGVSGVNINVTIDDIHIFLKLLLLLYADYTVLFSDDKDTLQYALNVFEDYCNEWQLTVNIQKTKIVNFSRGRANKRYRFTYQDKTIEIVDEYKYLGIFLGRRWTSKQTFLIKQ